MRSGVAPLGNGHHFPLREELIDVILERGILLDNELLDRADHAGLHLAGATDGVVGVPVGLVWVV